MNNSSLAEGKTIWFLERHGRLSLKERLSVAACLRAAAKRIVDRGWLQGDYGSCSRGYCVLGAIIAEFGGTDNRWDKAGIRYNDVIDVANGYARLHNYPEYNIRRYNDTKRTTKKDIVSALRGAASRIEEELTLSKKGSWKE